MFQPTLHPVTVLNDEEDRIYFYLFFMPLADMRVSDFRTFIAFLSISKKKKKNALNFIILEKLIKMFIVLIAYLSHTKEQKKSIKSLP
jgi:hypothetical protein